MKVLVKIVPSSSSSKRSGLELNPRKKRRSYRTSFPLDTLPWPPQFWWRSFSPPAATSNLPKPSTPWRRSSLSTHRCTFLSTWTCCYTGWRTITTSFLSWGLIGKISGGHRLLDSFCFCWVRCWLFKEWVASGVRGCNNWLILIKEGMALMDRCLLDSIMTCIE